MVSLGNPVRGRIYAHNEVPPPGAFWVTAAFGQIDAFHPAPLGHQGIDIGDGKCGSDIISMGRGQITAAYVDPGNGANIVRYNLLDYPGYEAGLAHMPSIETAVGVTFPMGTTLGHIGTSGASACHLHGGMKLNGVEIDWWPLLAQNGASDGGDMIPIPAANYTRLVNKKTSLTVAGNFRDERKSGNVLRQFPAATVFYPVAYANDGDVPVGSGSAVWYYGILYDDSPAGYIGGWFHSSVIGPLVDDMVTAGHSDQELQDATKRAGYNAANDVSAMAVATAAKYPKP